MLKLTNALLAIIAICLCLLVAKVYDISIVPEAHATELTEPVQVRVINDTLPCTVKGTISASIGTDTGWGWQALRGSNGALEVEVREK